MNIPTSLKNIVDQAASVAEVLYKKGWAEASSGNLSVNVTEYISREIWEQGNWTQLPCSYEYKNLASNIILISLKGSRMRQLAKKPEDNLALVYIDKSAEHIRYMPLNKNNLNVKPSSELSTHLKLHEFMVSSRKGMKAVLHTHPINLLSLTQIKDYNNQTVINNLLHTMHTETVVFIPEGFGFVKFAEPGSNELAEVTLEELNTHKIVLWEKHGCLAIGDSFDTALDRIEIAEKAAEIYMRTKCSGHFAEGLSKAQVERLRNL